MSVHLSFPLEFVYQNSIMSVFFESISTLILMKLFFIPSVSASTAIHQPIPSAIQHAFSKLSTPTSSPCSWIQNCIQLKYVTSILWFGSHFSILRQCPSIDQGDWSKISLLCFSLLNYRIIRFSLTSVMCIDSTFTQAIFNTLCTTTIFICFLDTTTPTYLSVSTWRESSTRSNLSCLGHLICTQRRTRNDIVGTSLITTVVSSCNATITEDIRGNRIRGF